LLARCASRWCARRSGTTNSSLTFWPIFWIVRTAGDLDAGLSAADHTGLLRDIAQVPAVTEANGFSETPARLQRHHHSAVLHRSTKRSDLKFESGFNKSRPRSPEITNSL
jgi:hypothetical protein